ncbi:TNF receptor-associated factor 5-like [Halichondria panicea]|uniref:TNF receptor-associated factor 5-like n=1 Tax=Halichondria panicea TaxID=6063 RepID=UPI00312B8E6B
MATPNQEPAFVKELSDKYKCSICTNLLDTPVLTECCGQHYCKACIEKWIIRKKESVCPHCRAENFNKIIALPLVRKIKELGVYCTNRNNGCKAVINYEHFQKHVIECLFGAVECTNDCSTAGLLRNKLEHHCKQECPSRIVHCKLCNEEGKHSVIIGRHIQICPDMTLACPNRCHQKVKRKDIDEHRNKCPLEEVDCSFSEAGCEVRLPRKHLENHERTSIQSHLRLTMATTAAVKRENKELKRDLDMLLSVVFTGSSLVCILPNNTTRVHMSNKLGVFREPGLEEYYNNIQCSSPALCIYPGFKIYLAFGNDNVGKQFFLWLEKSDIYGYPKTLSIEVQLTTGQSFSCSLNELLHLKDIRFDLEREVRFMMGDLIPNLVSNHFHANIKFTDIS